MELHPRVEALQRRFVEIDEGMRDLAIYNPAVEVEAFGFERFDDDWLIGVLITPWFMNLVLLPVAVREIEPNRYGTAHGFELPSGERSFLYNGDTAVGQFWGHSLHSPMVDFSTQAQARDEARSQLSEAMKPAAEIICSTGETAGQARGLSRRALLRGRPG